MSNEDYDALSQLAADGKITIEQVFPEKLGNVNHDTGGLSGKDWPKGCKWVYTVPNNAKDTTGNHTISDYENDVYNDCGFKYQCFNRPEILGEPGRVWWRYEVSQVVGASGVSISVTEYFFEEQKAHLRKLGEKAGVLATHIKNLYQTEEITNIFTTEVDAIKTQLKELHKGLIRSTNTLEAYKSDETNIQKALPDGADRNDSTVKAALSTKLEEMYENELTEETDAESANYGKVVSSEILPEEASIRSTLHRS